MVGFRCLPHFRVFDQGTGKSNGNVPVVAGVDGVQFPGVFQIGNVHLSGCDLVHMPFDVEQG